MTLMTKVMAFRNLNTGAWTKLRAPVITTQQTRDVHPVLVQCWPSVAEGVTALNQPRVNIVHYTKAPASSGGSSSPVHATCTCKQKLLGRFF